MPQAKKSASRKPTAKKKTQSTGSRAKTASGALTRDKRPVDNKNINNREKREKAPRTADSIACQLVPFILGIAAIFVVISFVSAEATGIFGGWLAKALYGLFSSAAFTIPVLLVIIAVYFRRDYVSYHVHEKLIFRRSLLSLRRTPQTSGGPATFSLVSVSAVLSETAAARRRTARTAMLT